MMDRAPMEAPNRARVVGSTGAVRTAPRVTLAQVSVRVIGGGGPFPILDDVSLEIAPGELLAIRGPSGAGKTTLLNVIGGLDPGYEGTVLLDGAPIWRRPDREQAAYRNRHVGFIFQEANLIQGLSAEENLVIPLLLRARSEPPPRARARALLEQTGLGDRAATRAEHLSGGERQRVATVRALIGEPQLVLADEPTGNLDPGSAHRITNLLLDYRSRLGATIIVATHDEEVLAGADRIVELRGGRIHVRS
jgi:ABC-type lipoprotein export system ATPase subunit